MPVKMQLKGLGPKFDRIAGKAARAIERPWRKRLRGIIAYARAAWPVRTGKSRNAIRSTLYLTPDGILVNARVDVDYATEIERDPWRVHLDSKVRALGRDVAAETVDELAALVRDA